MRAAPGFALSVGVREADQRILAYKPQVWPSNASAGHGLLYRLEVRFVMCAEGAFVGFGASQITVSSLDRVDVRGR